MSLKGTPESIIAQFIIEIRAKGAFLSVDEYSVIKKWVKIEPDADQILLILSDLLVNSQATPKNGPPKTLIYYEKKVSRLLQQNRIAKA